MLTCLQALAATGPADNGRAIRPTQGWRTWNQYQGAVSQAIVEANMRVLADRSKLVDGVPTSLADLGYSDAGVDDGWQQCGEYGVERYSYHSGGGDPIVNTGKFHDLQSMTRLGHSLKLTVGWYGNACPCADSCCKDHCDSLQCFVGDVNATLSLGFDSYKIDGCGAQRDIELWARLFNHSIIARGLNGSMMIENCHDGDGDGPGANSPSRDASGELWVRRDLESNGLRDPALPMFLTENPWFLAGSARSTRIEPPVTQGQRTARCSTT